MTRNVLDLLTEGRPTHLDPAAQVPAEIRHAELSRAMAGSKGVERSARRRGIRVVRPVWAAAGLAGVAAATAVAVAVSSSTPRAPGDTTRGNQGAVRLTASQVLLAAATQNDRRPDTVGRYWHTFSKNVYLLRAGSGHDLYTVISTGTDESWTAFAPSDESYNRSQYLGAKPLGAADEIAFKKAGSPGVFAIRPPKAGTKPKLLPAAPGPPHTSTGKPAFGDKIFWLGRNVSMKDLRVLPTDPAKLKAQLLKYYSGHDTESSSSKMSADLWLFTVTTGLVTDMPVTPKVRAAAFRMLSGLKSVEAAGTVRDAAGRSGIAVSVIEATRRHLLIIDPSTGAALGREDVLVKPDGATAGMPVGTVLNSETVQTAEWTNTR